MKKKYSILVVDDDQAMTQMAKVLLESEGYEVRTAGNGETAYDILKDPKCKCMTLDMMMPGINGAELLILMATENIDVPVIVVAGGPDFEEEELKGFPNVKKLIKKPFYPEELLKAILEVVPKQAE